MDADQEHFNQPLIFYPLISGTPPLKGYRDE